MMKTQKYINRIGRVLFSLIFIASGLSKIGDWDKTISYMENHNMVFTSFFLVIAILFQVIGGLSIITGFKTKIGTVLLLIFMIPVTFIFHDFWNYPIETELEMMAQQVEMVSFMKNITIIGALLLIFNGEKVIAN
ncbi:DoxX family protein [Crocinitomix catalasitica]|uniref:DoxX family protein n=1 Tax=Crocinitomix catalasitica TaxID=184607 RepID=UPI000482D99B|nr:DoxX family protein [Crocinitomix catalasitica]